MLKSFLLSAFQLFSLSAFCFLLFLPVSTTLAQSRTPWQMLDRTTVYAFAATRLGDTNAYALAPVPAYNDPGWVAAPNTNTIGFNRASVSGVASCNGNKQSSACNFTYFQCFVYLPAYYRLTSFTISLTNVDDGSRISLYNSTYTNGGTVPGSYFFDTGNTGQPGWGTADLSPLFNVGETNRVVITHQDDCNGISAVSNTAFVFNGVPALFALCTNVTVTLDPASLNCTTNVSVDNGSYTTTAGDTITFNQIPPPPYAAGTNAVTLWVTDNHGVSNSCTAAVVVIDTTPPAIACPADMVVSNAPGTCVATGVNLGVPITGDCTTVTVTNNAPASFPVGTNIVLWTARDTSGNTNSCTQRVIVLDTQPPQIICPSNITVAAPAGSCSSNVTFAVTATDNCAVASLTSVPASGSVFSSGITTVTSTAIDVNGNSNTCTFIVTVTESVPPVITCPANLVLATNPGRCSRSNVTYLVTAADCSPRSVVSVPRSGSTFPLGTTVVTNTATDIYGNTSRCTFTVTINDTLPPVFNCPLDVTIPSDASRCLRSNVTFTVTATDNCDGPVTVTSVPPSGSTFPVGTTIVTSTATDSHGNTGVCTFPVIVYYSVSGNPETGQIVLMGIDAEDGTVATSKHGPILTWQLLASNILGQATGGSGILVIGGGKTNTDDVTRFWNALGAYNGQPVTFANGSNNIATVSFAGYRMIGVASDLADTPSGGLTALENTALARRAADIANFVNNGRALLGLSSVFTPSATAAGPYAYMSAVGAVTLLVTPEYSNIDPTTAGFALGVNDTLDVCCWHQVFATYPGFLRILAYKNGTNSPGALGGNVSIPVFTVTCPVAVTALCPSSLSLTGQVYNTACRNMSVTWKVDGVTVQTNFLTALSPSANVTLTRYFGPGNHTVILTANDGFASQSCTTTVNINGRPVIACPANMVLTNDPGKCSRSNVTFVVDAASVCGGNVVVVSSPASGSTFPVGTTTVTNTATESFPGINLKVTNSCTFTVTVIDAEPPAIACPPDITMFANAGCSATNVDLGTPVTGDNCGVAAVASMFGNVSSAPHALAGPFFNPANDHYYYLLNSNSWTVSEAQAVALGGHLVTINDAAENAWVYTNFTSYNGVTLSNLWIGLNDAAQEGNFVWASGEPVTYTHWYPGEPNNYAGGEDYSTLYGNVDAGHRTFWNDCDNIDSQNVAGVLLFPTYGVVEVPFAPQSPYVFNLGTNFVTWTATDIHGNSNSCVQLVIVRDPLMPAIACPADLVLPTDPGECSRSNVTFAVNFTGNCSGASLAQPEGLASGATFPKGTTTNRFVAADGSGHATNCFFTVTIADNEPPAITCPLDLTIDANSGGGATNVALGSAVATDNCAVAGVSNDAPAFLPAGTNTVTWTATDTSGNSSACPQRVVVGRPCTGDLTATDITNVTICASNPVVFMTVAGSHDPIGYTWKFNPANGGGAGGQSLPDKTNHSLVLPSVGVADAGTYTVEVRTECGVPALTRSATLTVMPLPDSNPVSYTNAEGIIINTFGKASPYGSLITPRCVPGVVKNVTVWLQDFTHRFPADVNAVLMSPDGRAVKLMSGAGGGYSLYTGVDLFITDAATALPVTTNYIVSGDYHPSDYLPNLSLPGPVPPPPYPTNLSTFIGADPNGPWQLFVYDNSSGDGGNISSWSLNIEWEEPGTNLHLQNPRVLGNGSFQAEVLVQPGLTSVVQFSTNLTFWIPVATNVYSNYPGIFTDVPPPQFPFRFYRARLLP